MKLTCPKCGHEFRGDRMARVSENGYVHRTCPRLCSIEGCTKSHFARGWCRSHYDAWRDNGDPHTYRARILLRAEQLEDVEWMAETGETWDGAATRLGVAPSTLEKFLSRAGRRDLIRTLMRSQRGWEAAA